MEYKKLEEINKLLKTTDIKGKNYIEVNERIKAFWKICENGKIETKILSLENNMCVIQALVFENKSDLNPRATGIAYEKEGSTFINKTSYIENCVPIDTQILTNNGWKYYYQLDNNDKALSLNLETNTIEYCNIKNTVIYKNSPLVEMKTSRFKVKCTPQHKWVVDSQYTPIERIETNKLKKTHRIITNVEQKVLSSELGKKLGWLMCDCEIKYTKNGLPTSAEIRQSKHIKEIETLFGKGNKVKKYNDNWLDNYKWQVSAEIVREILSKFKIITYKDLAKAMLEAPLEDVRGCYESMMMADGTKGRFYSTYYELVEAMQIICARLGISTTFIIKTIKKNSTKPLYVLGIKKTSKTCVSELTMRNIPPQDVWCVETENHTWFMKQETFVTLTSNCETSAVRKSFRKCWNWN